MSTLHLDPEVPGNRFSPHVGYADSMADDEIMGAVRDQLAAEGRKKDIELVIVPEGERRRVIALGAEQNPWGFDQSDLFSLGYVAVPADTGLREVQWDAGRALWAGDDVGTSWGPESVHVSLYELRHGPGSSTGLWAVIVDGHIGGITNDPDIVGRAERGEITNLDGLTFPASHIVSMREDLSAEALEEIEASELTEIGSAPVDSGQVMVADEAHIPAFREGDMDRSFDPDDDSFTYAGACSQTLNGGGTLRLEGESVAAASSSGYGDGAYPVIRVDRDDVVGPASALLVDFGVVPLLKGSGATPRRGVTADDIRGDDLGTFRLGHAARVMDPCYIGPDANIDGLSTLVETVPGLYQACAINQSGGERRTACLLVYRIDD